MGVGSDRQIARLFSSVLQKVSLADVTTFMIFIDTGYDHVAYIVIKDTCL